jgi:MFS family permease
LKIKWPHSLGALESRNYRLFFFGQMISLTGTWISQTASLWQIYQLDPSPFVLGLVGFSGQFPVFFMAPFVGVWADRLNRHRLLLFTQVAAMLVSFILAALSLTSRMTPGWLIGLSLLHGIIKGIDTPTRQALVVAFVERREHLSNAIALNASLFNLSRLAGPAIAGFIIAGFGPGVCYLVDALTFAAVIVSLLAMRLEIPRLPVKRGHPLVELREGFIYVARLRPIRFLMLTMALFSVVGFSHSVLLPLFARQIFSDDARVLGYLMSASGLGALAGAFYLGSRSSVLELDSLIVFGGAAMGCALIAFSTIEHSHLAYACLMLAGFGGAVLMASINTLIQTIVTEEKRGRVMSIFTMCFTGMMPVGNFLLGWMASLMNPFTAIRVSGVFCLIVIFGFYRKTPEIRISTHKSLESANRSNSSNEVH